MGPSLNVSSASSMHSIRDTSLSRRPSIDDVPEDEPSPPTTTPPPFTSPNRTPPLITPPTTSSPGSPAEDGRGRKHARFSFAGASSLLDGFKDRVRSSSPKTREARNATVSRERGRARAGGNINRGATLDAEKAEKEKEKENHRKSAFTKLLKGDDKEGADGWKEFKKGAYFSLEAGTLQF